MKPVKIPSKKRIKDTLEAIGYTPRPYQIDVIYRLLTVRTLGMSIPRQNGKTETAIMAGVISGLRGDTVIFLLHNGDLMHQVAHRTADKMQPLLDAHVLVKDITLSVNRNIIEFQSGGKIVFKIRSSSGIGVGLTADLLICDEAQKMTQEELESALPVTTTSPRRGLLLMGTPPTDEDLIAYPDSPLMMQRKSAKGTTGWMEWGIGDYDPRIKSYGIRDAHAANPAWKMIPDFNGLIRQEQSTLSIEAYARQRLGAWVLPDAVEYHDPEFTTTEIKKVLSPRGPSRSYRLRAGVGIYPDSSMAYVCYSDGVSYEILPPIPVHDGDLSDVIDTISSQARVWSSMRLPANSRGKAIIGSQEMARYKKKIKLSSMPETATSIGVFCKHVHDGDVSIFRNDEAASALGSMWRGYNERSATGTVEASTAEMRACALAMVLATGSAIQHTRNHQTSWVI